MIAVLTAAVLGIVFYGWQLVEYTVASLGFRITSPLILITIQWLAIFLVMLFACELIYNLLPDFKRWQWAQVSPGSVVAILLWLLLTGVFRVYLIYFDSYSKTYGSLGAMIILMLWLYLTAVALMIGGAINAVLSEMSADDEKSRESS